MDLRLISVLIFTVFMPLTAISFFKFRLTKKETEFNRITSILNFRGTGDGKTTPSLRDEYAYVDYMLPLGFATLVSFVGSYLLFFGGDYCVLGEKNGYSLLLSGTYFPGGKLEKFQEVYQQNLVVMVFAFLGGYIWAMQDIIRRLIAIDITPGTYFYAAWRMIVAAMFAILLSYFVEDVDIDTLKGMGISRDMLPVIAFLTGMFPERTLLFIREKIPMFSPDKGKKAKVLPLDMLEGINSFHRARLIEAGVDNAQNLATKNLGDILVKTPFNVALLLDWIAQAKLYVIFKSDIDKLRAVGVRTILDLKGLCGNSEKLKQIAEKTGLHELTLSIACLNLQDDPQVLSLEDYRNRLGDKSCEAREPASMGSGK